MRSLTALLAVAALVLAGVAPATAAGGAPPAVAAATSVDAGPEAPARGGSVLDSTGGPARPANHGARTACTFPFSATDATGTEVTVEAAPDRVTTLGPSAAQTMWEIGGKAQVVGLTQYATYLEGADSRTNVSAGFGVSVEAVVGTNPDLVLAPNIITNETVEKLRAAGLTVYRFEAATSVADVREKTTLIGRLTGNCRGAARTNAWMTANVEAAREATADVDRVRVLYPLGGGYVANTGTFISAIIRAAGGHNVVSEANVTRAYPQLSSEVILELQPEYLVLTEGTAYLASKEPYTSLPAVENDNVVTVNGSYMSQPAPRSVVYSVRNLTEAFHPDAYAEAEFVARSEVSLATPTATASPTPQGQTGGATATPTDTTTPVPGFTLGLTALALLASALLARRR